MKRNFGFEPYEGSGKYGFVSYKSDEYITVGKYAKALSEKGVNLWYDYGIPKGKWKATISEKIVGASFVVLFVSAKIFESDFIKIEIETARKFKIPIIPVFMEDLRISQIAPPDATFFTKLDSLQGVSGAQNMSVEAVADKLERLVRPKMADDKKYTIITIIIAVAIVLAVAIMIGSIIYGISNTSSNEVNDTSSNTTNDNLHNIKSVDDITSIDEISVGDHLTFGTYEQDNDTSNGKEDIEWRVLAVEDGKALLITEKLLDYVQYNDTYESVTWETCTLRKWMNGDFLNAAFTSSEQNKIATTTLSNPNNLDHGTEGGNNTQDKIFALSIDEANKYFSSDGDMIAYVTECAETKGYVYDDGSALWWLRSSGRFSDCAANVLHDGGVNADGNSVEGIGVAVRPAFWLNL